MNKSILMIAALFHLALESSAEEFVKTKPSHLAVALTFDDGPDPRYTPLILEILARYKVPATFFVLGASAKAYPELIKSIKAAGHSIANHSYSHPNLKHLSAEAVTRQIRETNAILKSITGSAPKCLRPPYGAVNSSIRALAEKEGLKVVTWDLNSFDYTGTPPEKLAQWVLGNAKLGGDILMHDSGRGGDRTSKALATIIEGYQKRNIAFESLCE